MLTHIDLFSGIGGFALAAQWAGFKTVAFVEIEPYAQEIIKQNFGAVADTECDGCNDKSGDRKTLRESGDSCSKWRQSAKAADCRCPRIYGDIRQFDGRRYAGAALLTGGFPCQPFSQAGKRRGKEDDRYLWPEMLRVIGESKPHWVLAENVAGIINMELDSVLSDLESEGYATGTFVIPACAVDARHRRDRVWIVANARRFDSERRRSECGGPKESGPCDRASRSGEHAEHVADSEGIGSKQATNGCEPGFAMPELDGQAVGMDAGCSLLQGRGEEEPAIWQPEPRLGRVAHGIPSRVDRLKGLGNAIVPQVAYQIIKVIAQLEAQPCA